MLNYSISGQSINKVWIIWSVRFSMKVAFRLNNSGNFKCYFSPQLTENRHPNRLYWLVNVEIDIACFLSSMHVSSSVQVRSMKVCDEKFQFVELLLAVAVGVARIFCIFRSSSLLKFHHYGRWREWVYCSVSEWRWNFHRLLPSSILTLQNCVEVKV